MNPCKLSPAPRSQRRWHSALAAPAMAQFTNVYFFGDSLTDCGLVQAGPAARAPGCSRPTRARSGSQLFAQTLRLHGDAGEPGRQRLRLWRRARDAAARRTRPLPPTGAAVPIATQVQQLLAKGPLDGNAIYSVWGGANDIFYQLGRCCRPARSPPRRCRRTSGLAATQLAQQVGALQRPGCATTSWSATSPTSGKTPRVRRQRRAGRVDHRACPGLFNSTLYRRARRQPACRRSASTPARLFNEILANPAPTAS